MALPKNWKQQQAKMNQGRGVFEAKPTKQAPVFIKPQSVITDYDDCYDCENETMNRVARGACPEIKGGMVSPVGKNGTSKNPCPPKDSEIEEIITEAEVDDVKTAGLSQVPTFIWYLLGGVVVLYIAKKNKIINL
mgnify:CR=1 FL=1|tara:strand:+ start:855 stop:1259 length:405 start_codon:yes stop_codon:yes gene_type:complete